LAHKCGVGARAEDYAGAEPKEPPPTSDDDATIKDLYADPNSRFGPGGTGFLRTPLDAPRGTRAEAPEWLDRRDGFLQTLKQSRPERAERILCGFYVESKTDEEIARAEGWTKDAIKKERKDLVREGNDFYQLLETKHPPSPAIRGKMLKDRLPTLPRANHPPAKAVMEEPVSPAVREKDSPMLPTDFVAALNGKV